MIPKGNTTKSDNDFDRLPLKFHPRLFEEFGGKLVTNDTVAIIEFVKNSYDAFATRVEIRFVEDETGIPCIEIEDNGEGMSRTIIEDVWCEVGTPFRMLKPIRKKGQMERRVSGSKGIGRLCAARLGKQLEMITKTKKEPCWHVKVDWKKLSSKDELDTCFAECREYTDQSMFKSTGTLVRIKGLYSVWDNEKIEDLKEQLSRLVSPFQEVEDFKIWIKPSRKKAEPAKIESPKFLHKPPYLIKGQLDLKGELNFTYNFSKPGQKGRKLPKREELWANKNFVKKDRLEEELSRLPKCGPFSFEIRVWDLEREDIEEISGRFNFPKSSVREAIRTHKGISLYRDGILVLPKTEAGRDWLGLDLRRVSRVGKRLSTSNIVGYVAISADINSELEDTADRERLVDKKATVDFQKLIFRIVEILEEEREKDRLGIEYKEPPFKDLFSALSSNKLVEDIRRLAEEGAPASEALPVVEEHSVQVNQTVGQIERRLIYYSRLATIGTLAAMLLHEVKTKTTIIGGFTNTVKEILVNLKNGFKKIKRNLEFTESAVRSLERLSDRFSPLASRAYRTRRRDCVLENIIEECKGMRERQIEKLKIEVRHISSSKHRVAVGPGELIAIILNLLDNSLYWLEFEKQKTRKIEFWIGAFNADKDRIYVKVSDNGPGIDPEYEERIFWPGVSRKPEGLGMGLTVAAELVDQSGGRMHLIQPGELGGATFGFDLPLLAERKMS